MSTSIKWFGSVLLGVAGIALLVSVSAIGDVIDKRSVEREATQPEKQLLRTLIGSRWPYGDAVDEVTGACWHRLPAGGFSGVITGTHAATDAEILTELRAGRGVKKDGIIEATITYTPNGAERAALVALMQPLWGRDQSLITSACARRGERKRPIEVLLSVTGELSMSDAEAVARARSHGVRPRGVAE